MKCRPRYRPGFIAKPNLQVFARLPEGCICARLWTNNSGQLLAATTNGRCFMISNDGEVTEVKAQ